MTCGREQPWQIRKREWFAQTVAQGVQNGIRVLKVGSEAFTEPKLDQACQQLSEEENTIRCD